MAGPWVPRCPMGALIATIGGLLLLQVAIVKFATEPALVVTTDVKEQQSHLSAQHIPPARRWPQQRTL